MAYFCNTPLHIGFFCTGYKYFIKRLDITDLYSSKYWPKYCLLLWPFLESETIYSKEIQDAIEEILIYYFIEIVLGQWKQSTIFIVSTM